MGKITHLAFPRGRGRVDRPLYEIEFDAIDLLTSAAERGAASAGGATRNRLEKIPPSTDSRPGGHQ
jgi:hypothetical protein